MLAALERELEEEPFLVVGVHSPKFPNERDAEMVHQAVRRHGVTHPVVVDPGHRIWDEFGVRGWPTLVLLDAAGNVAAAGSGEPDPGALREAVRELLPGEPAPPLPLRPEPPEPGSLAYPGKVVVGGGRVLVADTGHGHVVECDLEGRELRRLTGFRHPNGLALVGDDLYVADTGSHSILRVRGDRVERVAGTGAMAQALPREAVPARETALRSPWDLAWADGLLYVAMAGSHQIWFYDPAVEEAGVLAGTGHELRRDGPAATAAFAQPSGLAAAGGSLYVADSEISSIRRIDDLDGTPVVRTVCGSGDLFGFGDRDGVGSDVLLQHPIGVAAGPDGLLYVADSFNHKVKRVDPRSGECRTLFGAREPERLPELLPGAPLRPAAPGEPAFFEPEGVAVADGTLLVADTNNHRVQAIELETGERRVLIGS